MLRVFIYLWLIACLVGCESVGNLIISAVPNFGENSPPIAEKEFDKKAKDIVPTSDSGIVYVSMKGKLNKCGNADVWLDDIYIGRVFLSTYLFFSVEAGKHRVKIQDQRINLEAQEVYFHTTSFDLTIESEQKYLVDIYPIMEKCAFYESYCAQICSVKEYSALEVLLINKQSDVTFLDGQYLSRLNEFDAKERGVWNSEINGQRVLIDQFGEEDLCGGRETPNWSPPPGSWEYKCTYKNETIVIKEMDRH